MPKTLRWNVVDVRMNCTKKKLTLKRDCNAFAIFYTNTNILDLDLKYALKCSRSGYLLYIYIVKTEFI